MSLTQTESSTVGKASGPWKSLLDDYVRYMEKTHSLLPQSLTRSSVGWDLSSNWILESTQRSSCLVAFQKQPLLVKPSPSTMSFMSSSSSWPISRKVELMQRCRPTTSEVISREINRSAISLENSVQRVLQMKNGLSDSLKPLLASPWPLVVEAPKFVDFCIIISGLSWNSGTISKILNQSRLKPSGGKLVVGPTVMLCQPFQNWTQMLQ